MSKSGPANDEETAMKETPQVVDKKVQSKAPLPRQDTGAPSMAEKATIDGIKQLLKNDKSKTRFDALEVRACGNPVGPFHVALSACSMCLAVVVPTQSV